MPPTPRLRQVSSCASVKPKTPQHPVQKMIRLAAAPASGACTSESGGPVVGGGRVVVVDVVVVDVVVVDVLVVWWSARSTSVAGPWWSGARSCW